VGVRVLVRRGERVEAGQPVAEVHAADPASGSGASAALLEAFGISPEPLEIVPAARRVIGA
jgi:thymidine phosphorylase